MKTSANIYCWNKTALQMIHLLHLLILKRYILHYAVLITWMGKNISTKDAGEDASSCPQIQWSVCDSTRCVGVGVEMPVSYCSRATCTKSNIYITQFITTNLNIFTCIYHFAIYLCKSSCSFVLVVYVKNIIFVYSDLTAEDM